MLPDIGSVSGGAVGEGEELAVNFADAVRAFFAVDAFEWAVAKGYINGMTLTTLAPQAGANRAQAVTVLYRYLNG